MIQDESAAGVEGGATGWLSGLLGVIIFSGSLPATRVAVLDFSPLFLTMGRAVVAAVLGCAFLAWLRQPKPVGRDITSLIIVAVGVVIGFPLLTALALQHMSAAHSIVFVGLLPLSTALFGIVRGNERPPPAFWLFSIIGAASVVIFALYFSDGGSLTGDLLMTASILLCGLGYAEGATLSRRMGGWQVISWALIVSLPFTALFALGTMPEHWGVIGWQAWAGFGYVSILSMMLGFVFWYRGLASGGIAAVGQLQLLQPFFGFLLAGVLLGEPVTMPMIASSIVVIGCVAASRKFSVPSPDRRQARKLDKLL